jgi:hypothetical protein
MNVIIIRGGITTMEQKNNTQHEELQIDQAIHDEGISLKELFMILWKRRYLLIFVTLFVFTITLVLGFVMTRNESKVATIVEFQWNGITQGQYPDNQRFDYGSVFQTFVINDALLSANVSDINSTDVRKNLKITPIVPIQVLEQIENALLRGIQITYYPTMFKITLDNGALGISVDEAKVLIYALLDGFRADFERKYIQRTVILDYTEADLTDFDYIDSYDILNSQVRLIRNAVATVMPNGNEFISSELGLRFNDISVRVNLVNDIELVNMSSRINNYLLSKDKDLLITRYSYLVETKQLELVREQTVQANLTTLITGYTGGTNTIIIPGLDPGLIPNLDPYLNTLYSKLVESQSLSATIEKDITFYQTRITRLEGNDPLFIVTPQKEAEEIMKVEASILRSSEALGNISSDLNIMLTEYNQLVTRNLIKPMTSPELQTGRSILLYAAIGLVLGGIVGVGTVFVLDAVKKNKLSKEIA